MRKSEVMGLVWERVDFARGVIQLEKTKTDRRREIPMRPAVYDVLAPLRAAALEKLPAETAGRRSEPRGGVWPSRCFPRDAWYTALDRAGLEDFHFHDTRHHFASAFTMRGGNLLALQKILGHRRITMTERYAHLSPGHLRDEMERTASSFSTTSAQRPKIDLTPPVSPRETEPVPR